MGGFYDCVALLGIGFLSGNILPIVTCVSTEAMSTIKLVQHDDHYFTESLKSNIFATNSSQMQSTSKHGFLKLSGS